MKHFKSELKFNRFEFHDQQHFESWQKSAIEKMMSGMSRYIIDNNLAPVEFIGDDYIDGDKLRPTGDKTMRLDVMFLTENERTDIVQQITELRMLLPPHQETRIASLLRHFYDRP